MAARHRISAACIVILGQNQDWPSSKGLEVPSFARLGCRRNPGVVFAKQPPHGIQQSRLIILEVEMQHDQGRQKRVGWPVKTNLTSRVATLSTLPDYVG